MPWMPSGPEVDRGFGKLIRVNKSDPSQGLQLRQSSEKFGYYLVDGERQFHVSSKARPSGGVGRGRLSVLTKYLKLTRTQFRDLCECRMTGPQYHEMIRDRFGIPGSRPGE